MDLYIKVFVLLIYSRISFPLEINYLNINFKKIYKLTKIK